VAGDRLYLPFGTLHRAITGVGGSAHLTFELMHTGLTWADLVLAAARELFHQISLVSPLFSAHVLWQIALPPLGGVAAICHRPLGVWHPKKVAKPDQF
jgi:hypothetical protein